MKLRKKHLILSFVVLFTFMSTLMMIYTLYDIAASFTGSIHEKEANLRNLLCKKPLVKTIMQSTTTTIEVNERSPIEVNARPPPTTSQKSTRGDSLYVIKNILNSLRNEDFITNSHLYDLESVMYNYSYQLIPYHRYLSTEISQSEDYGLIRQLFPATNNNNNSISNSNNNNISNNNSNNNIFNKPHQDRIQKQLNLHLNSTTLKTILVYNYARNLNTQKLLNSQCEINHCKFTSKKSDIEIADAVIFRMMPEELRRPVDKSNQVWIYSQLESPYNTILRQKTVEKFNWTATYRSDSVLNTPYAKFKPFSNITKLPIKSLINHAKTKNKLAAWFASNCYGQSGRSNYVKELQKYAKVDIYGKCGPLKCNRYNKECFQMLRDDYKFYLSFENTNCRDYITEKFFLNALENNVIPIVMGAHPDDYRKLAPPHSFIHVDEFDSPRQLAEYMHILDNNDDLYNAYFRWKGTGEFMDTKFICRLCAMVQVAHLFPTWYDDLKGWWKDDKCAKTQTKKGWATWREKLITEKTIITQQHNNSR